MNNILLTSRYYKIWRELNTLADSTVIKYTGYLKLFGEYIEAEGMEGELDFDKFYYGETEDDYAPIDMEFFDGFMEYISESDSQSKAKNCFTAVKSFMNFLLDYELISYNPLRFYQNPFYYETFRNRTLTEEESLKLLKAALELDPFFQQYYLLVLFQLTCGLRASELCKLSVNKINFEMDCIFINQGQKTTADTVRITPALKKQLKRYIAHPAFNQWAKEQDRELFFYNNKPLRPIQLNRILDQIRKHANINRKVTNHDLRATMAYLLYNNGVSPREIQKQLRHKKLKTTLIYLPFHLELDSYLD